ncbi:Fruit-body specific protein a [Mycena venus]|uniref:Fruit-body specific protein a n=1 Tax=Mycena venus TaxID=2733690 RepID=A0A8H6XXG3_9AGAR|nr:Fruit-body specific protein a [Mycena venus]
MRFSTLFTALAVVATGSSAATFSSSAISSATKLTSANHYGAPIAPWKAGHYPGWYYGKGVPPKGVTCFLDELFCELLDLFPFGYHCPKPPQNPPPNNPPPSPGVQPDLLQFDLCNPGRQLLDLRAHCEAMCDSVYGCTFFNTYHDVNGKNGSPQLTCALFEKCLTASSADNCGGQTQPDGTLDYITNSDGYCKKKATGY